MPGEGKDPQRVNESLADEAERNGNDATAQVYRQHALDARIKRRIPVASAAIRRAVSLALAPPH